MKRQIAESICRSLDGILAELERFNNYVNTNCDASEINRIRPAIATCVAELDLEVLEPIYKEYPELKPKDL